MRYEDLAYPPVPPRQRQISVDDVVTLANEFVGARFFEGPDGYWGRSFYVRQGEQLLWRGMSASDGPEWDLSFQLGRLTKSVHLYMDYPEHLGSLRDHVDRIGGPQAWSVK